VEIAAEDAEAFVREETKGQFGLQDVQKLIASINTDIGLRNIGRSVAQGALFNFADELMGVVSPARKEEMRLREDLYSEEHPVANMVGQLGGGLALPGGEMGTALRRGAPVAQAVAKGVGIGAAAGALSGAGSGEGLMERGDNAALGAGLGAIVGGAVPAVVGAGKLAFRPAARADRRLALAIKRSGGPDALRTENARLGAAGRGNEAQVSDLSDYLSRELDFAANADDATSVPLAQRAAARQADMSGRLLDDTQSLTGAADAGARLGELQASRRAWAASDAGFEGLRKANPEITDVDGLMSLLPHLEQPHVAKALERARAVGMIGDAPDMGRPSFQQLFDVKQALRAEAKKAFATPGQGELGARLKEVADAFDGMLRKSVPEFDAVSNQYASRKGLEDALEQGVDWYGKEDSRGLGDYLKGLAPEQVTEFRRGLASQLVTKLRGAATNRDEATRLMNQSKALQDKLELAFGSKQNFEQFMEKVAVEAQMSRRIKGPLANSSTARRLTAQGFDPLEIGADIAVTGGSSTALASILAKLGKGVMARRTAAQLGPRLMTRGTQDIDEFLRQFSQQPGTVGGVAGGMLPTALGGLMGSWR
jgi:hypothetical protein